MKKLIATCLLITSVSAVSMAQSKTKNLSKNTAVSQATLKDTKSKPSVEMIAERRAKSVQQQYGLTDAQYKGVYAAELDFEQQLELSRSQGAEPGEGQMMQMKMGRDYQYKNAMNAEQFSKYEAAQQKQ